MKPTPEAEYLLILQRKASGVFSKEDRQRLMELEGILISSLGKKRTEDLVAKLEAKAK